MSGTVDPLWPWQGISVAYGIGLAVALVVLLALVPLAWWLLRHRYGPDAAGPLWPLVLFEVLALAYALVVPPWQKPDEPQHMARVEITRVAGPSAAEKLLPGASRPAHLTSIERQVNARIARSMDETDAVYWLPGYERFIADGHTPGPSELTHPPLYYLITGTLTRPFAGSTVLSRLAVIRILGVALAGCVVWCCGAAGRLLFGRRKVAEAPAAVAISLPAFVLLAGSVNSDVLAEFFAALLLLLLLAGVLERTAFARPVVWFSSMLVLVALGVLTKRTFIPVAAMTLVAIALRLRRHPRPMLAALAAALAVTGVVVARTATPRPALWQGTLSAHAMRCKGGHSGAWSICLSPMSTQVTQRIALPRVEKLEDSDAQLRLWARGSGPGATLKVDLESEDRNLASQTLSLTPSWTEVAVRGHIPLSPHILTVALTRLGGAQVDIDEVSLTEVDTFAGALAFAPPTGAAAGNAVVNGSAEIAVLATPDGLPGSVRRALDSSVDSIAGVAYEPSAVIDSIGIINHRATQTFSSMWATIGWQGELPLFPGWLGWLLGALVIAGLLGFVGVVLRIKIPLVASTLLVVSLLTISISSALRTIPPDEVLVISGRYLYTGLVVFSVVIAAGWHQLWRGPEAPFRATLRALPLVMHALFVAILLVPFLVNGVRL